MVIKGSAIDAEHIGSPADVAAVLAKRQVDSLFLDRLQQPVEFEPGIIQGLEQPIVTTNRAIVPLCC